jgi:ferric-dicitrate binding protein FerR (iron transport regulator)
MHRDEETNLKAAFAELHRRQREQAPPFAAMRERALRQADDRRSSTRRLSLVQRVVWGAVAVCLMAMAAWWFGRLPEPALPKPNQVDPTTRVDELITAIERHLELKGSLSVLEYPSDILLAENQTGLAQ